MNTNAKRIEYTTRDAILNLLSDSEVARLSMREAGPPLNEGEEYVDLERPTQGIRCVRATPHVAASMMLPRSAVGDRAWSEIRARLTAGYRARLNGGDVIDDEANTDYMSAEAARHPGCIVVHFEGVTDTSFRAAIANLQQLGRITAFDTTSQYGPAELGLASSNTFKAIGRRLTIHGIAVQDQLDLRAEFLRDMERWLKEGKVKWRQIVAGGIGNAPSALLGLLNGEFRGGGLVQAGPNDAARGKPSLLRPVVLHAERRVTHESARSAGESVQPTASFARPQPATQARLVSLVKREASAVAGSIAAPDGASLERAQRDLESARIRVEQNAERVYEEKRRELVVELLPVLDNLDRALGAETSGTTADLIDGVRMVRAGLEGVLVRYGVQRMDTVAGERFDPALHEAVAAVSVVDPELAGAVLRQATPGYRFAGKLLRAAKVSVGVESPRQPAG